MKKIILLTLILTMSLFLFVGCAQDQEPPTEDPVVENPDTEEPSDETDTEEPVDEPDNENSVKTGLAVITSVEKSKDAAEEDGVGQSDSVVVAVTVDQEGKIVKAAIDTAQTKINFSNEGKITSDVSEDYKSKQELGPEYGMKGASSLGREWNEQANALAEYVVGKTLEEVKGITVDESGVPTEVDLTSSVTIKVSSYIEAIEKAMNNAQYLGAEAEDKLGLGIETTIAKSKDAGEEDGLAQAYSNYTATTFDADGVITSSIIDASQANVNFDAEGKITSDLTAPVLTKNELGEDYGMKGVSDIGKEWNEQADAFSKYVVGKTIEEVTGLSVDESGHATEEDLTSSVTVGIGSFQYIIEEAEATSK